MSILLNCRSENSAKKMQTKALSLPMLKRKILAGGGDNFMKY